MNHKTRIAVLIAALMLGTQAGVAAIEGTDASEQAQAAEQRVEAIPVEPVAAVEPAATSEQEPVAAAEPAAPSMTEKAVGFMQTTASRVRDWFDRFVTALRSGASSGITPPPTFPEGSEGEELPTLLPAQVAYFERLEQERTFDVASAGSPFPAGSEGEELPTLLPAQVAYFERLEQQRLASLEPQPAPQAEAQPAAVDTQALAASTELLMAHDAAASAVQ